MTSTVRLAAPARGSPHEDGLLPPRVAPAAGLRVRRGRTKTSVEKAGEARLCGRNRAAGAARPPRHRTDWDPARPDPLATTGSSNEPTPVGDSSPRPPGALP